MTPKLILLLVLSCFLSFMAVLMFLQRRPTSELLIVALGALTGWSALICRGRLPEWIKSLWGDRITEDLDPNNLPLRIWLPLVAITIVVAGVLIFYAARF
jgi:hypothetical protein